ncbi:retron Ec67 family RNA-directed DNA polymerase/endonuclease [Robbsia sp. KACC 23696]|uniref:retron Ec67 family RNA-directed DNA polymerase/endonuclease n=1 Tax=Robbsia sp. KACC 23696 TaxID=3149231 RepID=UPI00325AE26D
MNLPLLSALEKLQASASRAGLAETLEITVKHLTYLLYVRDSARNYRKFSIPKKHGGVRIIHAPEEQLASLQRKLAVVLQRATTEIEHKTNFTNNASHGFRPQRSILTNASVHRNRRFVLNIDLQDFFPSITGARIRGFLIQNRHFALTPAVATAIAHIACKDGLLVQGSPSSPVISNLIASILDFHLARLARECGCTYTRYADDITFSTNKRVFPEKIASEDAARPGAWTLSRTLRGLIKKSGFSVNDKKTRMQSRHSRQVVTGLVVNKKVNVPAEYRHLVRAYVFKLIHTGAFVIHERKVLPDGTTQSVEIPGTHEQLHGMLGFIHSVDTVLRTELEANPYNHLPPYKLMTGKQDYPAPSQLRNLAIYRRFLLYTRFFATDVPLIVCEGKTDIVHISTAIHQCKNEFPSLVRKKDDGKDVLAVQFFKYERKHKTEDRGYLPNFSTAEILGVGSGGGPNLSALIRLYSEEAIKYQAPRGKNPVLFVVDNDSGKDTVISTIGSSLSKKVDRDSPFTHLFANAYLLLIPRNGKANSSIEDLYATHDVAKGLNGKAFEFSNKKNHGKTVGKAPFAYEFVAKRAAELDWSGFKPLLQNIVSSIEAYGVKIALPKGT